MNKYEILSSEYIHSLAATVVEYVQGGWIPVGGICYDGIRYIQAVTQTTTQKKPSPKKAVKAKQERAGGTT